MDLNIELVSRVEELLNDMTDDQVRQDEAAIPETERYRWGLPAGRRDSRYPQNERPFWRTGLITRRVADSELPKSSLPGSDTGKIDTRQVVI